MHLSSQFPGPVDDADFAARDERYDVPPCKWIPLLMVSSHDLAGDLFPILRMDHFENRTAMSMGPFTGGIPQIRQSSSDQVTRFSIRFHS